MTFIMRHLGPLFFLLILMAQMAVGRTIHVGPGREFKNIRPALHAAKDYDTVYVYHSRYKEGNIVINKKIVMIGVELPVLDGIKNMKWFR
jgi:nitrous oxidase accessory protein